MSAEYKMKLPLQTIASADAAARPLLEGAQQALGFVPNMYGGMANSPALLQTYLSGYDLVRKQSVLAPAEQEVVFLTVSREHGCTYCVAAHSMVGDKMTGVPADVLSAIRDGKPIPDAKLAALATFTQVMVTSRGNPGNADADAFLSAGYTERHMLDIILIMAVKTISNYSNHLFHTEVDAAFSGYAWKA